MRYYIQKVGDNYLVLGNSSELDAANAPAQDGWIVVTVSMITTLYNIQFLNP